MMRTIASESCFIHGLLIVAVTWCAVVVGDDKTSYRAQKMSVVVWGSGACANLRSDPDLWRYRFLGIRSEIPCWNIHFSPPDPRERKVLHREPFLFLLVDCIIRVGVTATPHKRGNVYARKCTLFSAHQATIAWLVFEGEHCMPSCSWDLV
jgi:hypothetical protein